MSGKNDLTKYEPEIRPFTGGDILHKPASEFSPGEAVLAYTVVQYIEKRAKARKEELKPRIMEDDAIIDHSTPTAGGGTVTDVRGSRVTRVKTLKRFANTDRLKELLEEKGIDLKEAFDEKRVVTTEMVVNPSKIEQLYDLGKFTAEEVEECHKTTWGLRIKAAKDITRLLESSEDDNKVRDRKMLFGKSEE
jgi:hypothetical protein